MHFLRAACHVVCCFCMHCSISHSCLSSLFHSHICAACNEILVQTCFCYAFSVIYCYRLLCIVTIYFSNYSQPMASSSDDPPHVDSGGSRCEPNSARSLADVLLARSDEGHEDYSRKHELLSIARPLRNRRKTEPAHPYQRSEDPLTPSTQPRQVRTASSTPVARLVHERVFA